MHYIIDVDTGIDDALSILYLLDKIKGSKHTLLGITCVYGNVDVKQATQNTSWLLERWNYLDIPIVYGASHSLKNETYQQGYGARRLHGENGIGDIFYTPLTIPAQPMNACDFLIKAAKQYGADLCIIASGPLTNIAQAIMKAPLVMKTIHQLVFMGGAYRVSGNITPYAEANIYHDPLAASIVLQSAVPATMIGLDVTMKVRLSREIIETWNHKDQNANDLYQLCDYYLCAYEIMSPASQGCVLHDPIAVAVACCPDFVCTKEVALNVVLTGEQTGRIIEDVQETQLPTSKTRVAIGVDSQRFLNDFIDAMNRVCRHS